MGSQRVAFVGDTHAQYIMTDNLTDLLESENVDTVVHLGDIDEPHTVEHFEPFTFRAIFGNHDSPKSEIQSAVNEVGEHLGKEAMLEYEGQQIFIYHGEFPDRAERIAENANGVQYVLHGHQHEVRRVEYENGVVMSPGTASAWVYEPLYDEWEFVSLDDELMYYEGRSEAQDLDDS